MSHDIDTLIREHLSLRNYRQGRPSLEGIDPGSRIRRAIWRDEGVDIEALTGAFIADADPIRRVIDIRKATVRVGFLRRKKDRAFITGLADPERLMDREMEEGLRGLILSSRLLSVPLILKEGGGMLSGIKGISLPPAAQSETSSLEPRGRGRPKGPQGAAEEDTSVFDRKAPKDRELVLKGGRRIIDLSSLIISVMEMKDEELTEMLFNGSLTNFARKGLGSPSLEAIFTDLSSPGTAVDGAAIRQRFGLYLMEGPLGARTVREVVAPLLARMEKCGRKEAYRIKEMLDPLMDERSAQMLLDMMFRAPTANRPPIISLLASTMSDLAVEPLTKVAEMSLVESDRKEARSALERMGASPFRSDQRL